MEHAFDTIAIPIASEEDAEATCRGIRPVLSTESNVVVIHVIEKAGGGIDPAPIEEQKRRANRIFDQCAQELSKDAGAVDNKMTFDTDVVDGIIEASEGCGADVIAFTPRSANRLLKLVSGDTAFKLIHRAELPVLIVPPSAEHVPDQQ